MIHVYVGKAYKNAVKPALLRKPAAAVLKELSHAPNLDVTIMVEDDDYLRGLNQQFLGIDAPTDVLSFPSEETDPDSGHMYLGDIAISYPRATEQAASAGHDVDSELQLLVIHGMLHLLGYDHSTADQKAEMWQLQERLLGLLSIQILRLPED